MKHETKAQQSSPVYSYLAHEISTVDSSSTPSTSPSQERKCPNNAVLKTQITVNQSLAASSLYFIYNDNKLNY